MVNQRLNLMNFQSLCCFLSSFGGVLHLFGHWSWMEMRYSFWINLVTSTCLQEPLNLVILISDYTQGPSRHFCRHLSWRISSWCLHYFQNPWLSFLWASVWIFLGSSRRSQMNAPLWRFSSFIKLSILDLILMLLDSSRHHLFQRSQEALVGNIFCEAVGFLLLKAALTLGSIEFAFYVQPPSSLQELFSTQKLCHSAMNSSFQCVQIHHSQLSSSLIFYSVRLILPPRPSSASKSPPSSSFLHTLCS